MTSQHIYRVFPNRTAWNADKNPVVAGMSKWKLPSINCPSCGIWGRVSVTYPWIDLSGFSNRKIYKGNKVCVMSPAELAKATEPIRALLPTEYDLPPATSLGAFKGKHIAGVLEDFYFYHTERLLSRRAFERLQAREALGINATPAVIKGRKGATVDYVELHLVPRAKLAVPKIQEAGQKYCPDCGFDQRSLPQPLIISKETIPAHEEIFQLRDSPIVKLATEKFVETVKSLGLTGLEFEPVEVW